MVYSLQLLFENLRKSVGFAKLEIYLLKIFVAYYFLY